MGTSLRSRIRLALLAVIAAAAAARLARLAAGFGRESLQADFSAFYTAGQAVRAGLSPYHTWPEHQPPLWDGMSLYEPSRFLYPPLAASAFAPLTGLDYAVAKRLWMVLAVAALAGALAVLARALRRPFGAGAVLALAAGAAAFHPLLVHLERGQIDCLTLLLIALALRPLIAAGRDTALAGLLLAAGAVLKPSVAGLVFFLVLRRRWRAIAGFVAGGLAAAALTAALQGPPALRDYLTVELPRISRAGEAHGEEHRLAPEVLARLRGDLPPDLTRREGRVYRIEAFRFVTNGSLVRPLKRRLGLAIPVPRLSLVILLALWVLLALRPLGPAPGPLRELAFWQAALAAVLLSWPVTWAMNAVWLLPAALLVLAAWPVSGRVPRLGLAACALALGLAGVPESVLEPLGDLANLKYVAAELLVFAGLLAALPSLPGPAAPEAQSAGS